MQDIVSMAEAIINQEANHQNEVSEIIDKSNANEIVWKGIKGCKSFSKPVSVDEAIDAIGGNYNVEKRHLIAIDDATYQCIQNNQPISGITPHNIVDGRMATTISENGNILGVVSDTYGVVQNKSAFDFMRKITNDHKAFIETAGILGDGKRMYISAKMPHQKLKDEFGIDNYLLCTNSHDGSGAVVICFTPIRVICQNTLNQALRTAENKVSIRHTINVDQRVDWENEENIRNVKYILEKQKTFSEKFLLDMRKLGSTKIGSDFNLTKFASQIFANDEELEKLAKANYNVESVDELSKAKKNQIIALENCITYGIGQREFEGTNLWLFNGVTSYFSNEKKYRDNEQKLEKLFGGADHQRVQKAYDMLINA